MAFLGLVAIHFCLCPKSLHVLYSCDGEAHSQRGTILDDYVAVGVLQLRMNNLKNSAIWLSVNNLKIRANLLPRLCGPSYV